MYRGVAIWNYAGDAVTNAETFRKAGFDAISWNAPLFVDAYTDADRERAAEFLKQSGMYFTMHEGAGIRAARVEYYCRLESPPRAVEGHDV